MLNGQQLASHQGGYLTYSAELTLSLTGPARLVGDKPFAFGRRGEARGAFIRSLPGSTGLVRPAAKQLGLDRASVHVRVTAPGPGHRFL